MKAAAALGNEPLGLNSGWWQGSLHGTFLPLRMSKLTKFIRRPRQFVLDSRAYRRIALGRSQVLRSGSPLSTLSVGPFEKREELRGRILEEIGRVVPGLLLADGAWPQIAVLREHSHCLSGYLHALCRQSGLDVRLRSGRNTLEVAHAHLFAVDDFLVDAKEIDASIGLASGEVRVVVNFEIWKRESGELVGPKAGVVAKRISERTATERGLFEVGELRRVRDLLPHPLATDVQFPVDVVYTWVNHRDPGWRRHWLQVVGHPPEDEECDTRGLDRYMNRDELKFSLRSVAEFAPWVRRIFVVTNCAPPEWLDLSNPQIVWVDHHAVIPEEHLPTFNSHAIESRLHHVPGLADHFLYFNDDFFLMRPTLASDFFEATGVSKSFLEEYGSVHGDVDGDDPDYLNAARNGRRLIEGAFGRSVTALHKHTPYALRRDVLLEVEQRFPEPIARTTASRFRDPANISMVSFLYHHYAYVTARAIPAPSNAMLIKPQTARYERKLQQLLDGGKAPVSLCLNDGGGSLGYPHWNRHVVEFLETSFPEKSPFER